MPTTTRQLQKSIKAHIAKGKVQAAIDLLLASEDILGKEAMDEAVHLSQRFMRMKRTERQDLADRDQLNVELNKITSSLLDLANGLDPSAPDTDQPNTSRRGVLGGIVAGMGALFAGYKFFGPEEKPLPAEPASTDEPSATPTAPKINVQGNGNTVIDMSNSKENTVNQTFHSDSTGKQSPPKTKIQQ